MKNQKSKLILILIIILIVIVLLFQIRENQNFNLQEELIFLRLFSSHEEENSVTFLSSEKQENPTYDFQVAYQNIDFKDIYLADTIKPNTRVQGKIAPGTEGDFSILLQSNKKVKYRIQFNSTNEKPKNLYFQIRGNDRTYKKLEDMEKDLQGELFRNKRITIHWKWEYERNKEENKQDTKDGQTIVTYQFTVFAIGE